MRARLELLRNHPDLSNLEPELLQLAAQMSMQTRDLARAYSDQKVDRARIFQRQRQEEAHAMGERLDLAQHICNELRLWMADIESGESKNSTQINRLEADLAKILPDLCYAFDLQTDPSEGNVVTMPKSQKDPVLVGNRDNLN